MSQSLIADFIELALSRGVLRFGEFELKSGRISPYFFNAGLVCDSEASSLLAKLYASQLIDAGVTQLFGAAYKGIPLAAGVAQMLWSEHGARVDWGYNRKEAKAHGEGGQLVGAPVSGQPVWIIDDVITAGTAMREVISLLKAQGAQIAGVIVALDRKERGVGASSAIEELKAEGYRVEALFSIDEIIEYVAASPKLKVHLSAMQSYRETYGVG